MDKLLRDCEARLVESRRAADDALDLVRRALKIARGAEPATDASLARDRDELVGLVLSALRSGTLWDGDPARPLLHRDDDGGYRISGQRVGLTESERQLLDMLWRAMPASVSRNDLHS